jgi:hypothetical protein
MFLPATKNELNALVWNYPDVILVTGDTYVDSPFIGIAVIGVDANNSDVLYG